jgi:hypothetical protein
MSSASVTFTTTRYAGAIERRPGVASISTCAKILRWMPKKSRECRIEPIVGAALEDTHSTRVILQLADADDVVFVMHQARAAAQLVSFIQRGGVSGSAGEGEEMAASAAAASASVPPPPYMDAGLPNLGRTCFLNSAVQLLASIPEFARFLATKQDRPLAKMLKAILDRSDRATVEKQLKEVLKRREIDDIRDRNGNHADADAEEALTKILDAVDAIAGRDLDCGVELRDRTLCIAEECQQPVPRLVTNFVLRVPLLEDHPGASLQQLVDQLLEQRHRQPANCECGATEKIYESKYETTHTQLFFLIVFPSSHFVLFLLLLLLICVLQEVVPKACDSATRALQVTLTPL